MVARVIYELAGVAPAELGPCGSRGLALQIRFSLNRWVSPARKATEDLRSNRVRGLETSAQLA